MLLPLSRINANQNSQVVFCIQVSSSFSSLSPRKCGDSYFHLDAKYLNQLYCSIIAQRVCACSCIRQGLMSHTGLAQKGRGTYCRSFSQSTLGCDFGAVWKDQQYRSASPEALTACSSLLVLETRALTMLFLYLFGECFLRRAEIGSTSKPVL